MTAAAGEPRTIRNPVLRVASRVPATLATVAAVVIAGIVWQGLWSPFEDSPTYDLVAYGLPALTEGRWWTPFTGTFFVNLPWVYVFALGGFLGMAYVEYRRGWRLALGWFWIGQLFAVFGSALLLLVLSVFPWPWAQTEAAALDVGPSGGTMACIAVAVGLLVQPWRVRAWLVLLGFVFVALTFWGELADLEHALAVLLVLFVDRTLRIQRTTIREQRLIAFVVVLVIAAIELITLLVPTDGMFGPTEAIGPSLLDVTVDVGVVLLLANGLRRGRRWAWGWTVGYAILNVVTGVLLITVVATGLANRSGVAVDGLGVSIATSVLWLFLLVYLFAVRHAFRARRKSPLGAQPAPTVADVKAALHRHGGGTLSWMTTWDGNSYARLDESVFAYQRRTGVALVLADPIGPASERAAAIAGFVTAAERAGLVPCFFGAAETTRQAMPKGWRSLVVADDTIVDLPGLEFTGKKWGPVRTAINRAAREEVVFRMTSLTKEPWGVRQQLRAISEMWVGDKGLPEMGFTLGTLDEAEDPEVRLALAVSTQGDVEGFLSWLPVYGGDGRVRGWTLDLMRRRDGGFGPVMEFLIGSSARHFADEGADLLSLSGAPLTHEYPPDAGPIAEVTDRLAGLLEPVYGFGSLHRFKEKFHPRYETMYLLFRDESDLARIAPALTRAFLPDATLRQFAGAGLELIRGTSD